MIEHFPSSLPGSLAEELGRSYDGVIGCPEKTEIARNVKASFCYSLSQDIEACIGWNCADKHNFLNIMPSFKNIIAEVIEAGSVWIEFDYTDRLSYTYDSFDNQDRSIFQNARMGYLLVTEQVDDLTVVSFMMFWFVDGKLYANPSVMHFDFEHIKLMSEQMHPTFVDNLCNRSFNKKIADEMEDVFETLILPCHVRVMEGMIEDSKIIHNMNQKTMDEYIATCRYMIVSELPYLLYSLMFVLSNPQFDVTCPGEFKKGIWKNGRHPMKMSHFGVLDEKITGQVV